MSNELQNIIVNPQSPIQVKKVSELEPFMDYFEVGENNMTIDNAYLLVSYPSNKTNIKHNYKINLDDICNLLFTYYVNDKLNERIEEKIKIFWDDIKDNPKWNIK